MIEDALSVFTEDTVEEHKVNEELFHKVLDWVSRVSTLGKSGGDETLSVKPVSPKRLILWKTVGNLG